MGGEVGTQMGESEKFVSPRGDTSGESTTVARLIVGLVLSSGERGGVSGGVSEGEESAVACPSVKTVSNVAAEGTVVVVSKGA